MTHFRRIAPLAAVLLAACAVAPQAGNAKLDRGDMAHDEVVATERAFAKTMADRNLNAFATYISGEAVFFSGAQPLRGRQAIVDYWARFYSNPAAPFSWEPAQVEVLASGSLALSTGPVRDADGKLIGCFNSIWRQEAQGQWKIVFDRGSGPLECEKK
jgi:ketosteroid isomerase-like protein